MGYYSGDIDLLYNRHESWLCLNASGTLPVSDGRWFTLDVIPGGTSSAIQIACINSILGSMTESYIRHRGQAGWADWASIPTAADLAGKANRESTYLDGDTDLNALTDEGEYWSGWQNTIQNTPVHSAFHLSVKRLAYNDKYIVTQEYVAWTGEDDAPAYRRNQKTSGWGKWELVTTATPPQEYDLPLAAGVTGMAHYDRDQFGRAYFSFDFASSVAHLSIVTALPAGYRPEREIKRPVVFGRNGVGSYIGFIVIYPTGNVVLDTVDGQPADSCSFDHIFRASYGPKPPQS